MSNKRKKCRLLQNLYSIFLPNSKKRKKCRTKRKKCRLFKISIRHFFLNNKKRKKCRTIRHFCIRHFFIDSILLQRTHEWLQWQAHSEIFLHPAECHPSTGILKQTCGQNNLLHLHQPRIGCAPESASWRESC